MKKQLDSASWHYTLSCLPHGAEVLHEDPNSNHLSVTIFLRPHFLSPLAVAEAQIDPEDDCLASVGEIQQCDRRPHSHTKTGLPEVLPGMAGLWKQVCIC